MVSVHQYEFIDETSAHEKQIALGWERKEKGHFIISQKKGLMEVAWILVRDVQGKPLWDQILRYERPGAVFLPIDSSKGTIGLQEMYRPQGRDQEALAREYPNIDPSRLGISSFEVPRGFARPKETGKETALREGEGEIRRRVRSCIELGETCDNTSISAHKTNVFCGEVDPSAPTNVPDDPLEKIVTRLAFFSLKDIQELQSKKKLYCGYTLAAIALLLLDERVKFRDALFRQQ